MRLSLFLSTKSSSKFLYNLIKTLKSCSELFVFCSFCGGKFFKKCFFCHSLVVDSGTPSYNYCVMGPVLLRPKEDSCIRPNWYGPRIVLFWKGVPIYFTYFCSLSLLWCNRFMFILLTMYLNLILKSNFFVDFHLSFVSKEELESESDRSSLFWFCQYRNWNVYTSVLRSLCLSSIRSTLEHLVVATSKQKVTFSIPGSLASCAVKKPKALAV